MFTIPGAEKREESVFSAREEHPQLQQLLNLCVEFLCVPSRYSVEDVAPVLKAVVCLGGGGRMEIFEG